MSVKVALNEIEGIVKRASDKLLGFVSQPGRAGSELRLTVGDVRAHVNSYVRDGSFATRWLACFKLATASGMTLDWMDTVLNQLIIETPTTLEAGSVVQNSILFALAQDGRIIAATDYTSREEVEEILHRMKDWFDKVKDLAADEMDDPSYRALNNLAAAMTRYLADVARPLPRMLGYELVPQPALAMSQYIYGTGSRSEELAAENRVVHPAFMPRKIKALSA